MCLRRSRGEPRETFKRKTIATGRGQLRGFSTGEVIAYMLKNDKAQANFGTVIKQRGEESSPGVC